MERYFDVFAHWANWQTRIVMMKASAADLPQSEAYEYCDQDCTKVIYRGDVAILSITSSDEGGEWYYDEEMKAPLRAICEVREALIADDRRILYIGWLLAAHMGEFPDEMTEPPVPPGLRTPSPALLQVMDFLELDGDLFDEAATASADLLPGTANEQVLADWIATVPAADRDEVLARIARGDSAAAREWRSRWIRECGRTGRTSAAPGGRTVGELLAAANKRTDDRIEAEKRLAEIREEKARLAQAERREKHLMSLAGREEELWQNIEREIADKGRRRYGLVVESLRDLKEMDQRWRDTGFRERLPMLRERHRSKSAPLRKIKEAGL